MAKPRKLSKVKKKKWYMIVSPKFMGEKPIGESYLDAIDSAVGRSITVNLMQITGDMRKQSANLKFIISGIKESKLSTRIVGYEYSSASIKRLVRRRITRIDDSFIVLTKDNKKIRIKPFLLTRGKVSKSLDQKMRSSLKNELVKQIRNSDFESVFDRVIKGQLQKETREKLNKIYPVKNIEIRVLKEELGDGKVPELRKEETTEVEKTEKVEAKELPEPEVTKESAPEEKTEEVVTEKVAIMEEKPEQKEEVTKVEAEPEEKQAEVISEPEKVEEKPVEPKVEDKKEVAKEKTEKLKIDKSKKPEPKAKK